MKQVARLHPPRASPQFLATQPLFLAGSFPMDVLTWVGFNEDSLLRARLPAEMLKVATMRGSHAHPDPSIQLALVHNCYFDLCVSTSSPILLFFMLGGVGHYINVSSGTLESIKPLQRRVDSKLVAASIESFHKSKPPVDWSRRET